MDDIEKGSRQDLREPMDDPAATKLWTVYVSEAEKYDKALVESWRSDMNGMLILLGLFSAVLTAFLIESYPTLLSDSGDDTVFFLRQISQQLAASSSGTNFTVTEPIPHIPTTTSLVCNIFWFISLGLSLTCALVATLLEQWARNFIHRSEMRSAPLIRARIFSFLYFGLKRFNMHIVVEVIPLLLHASLILFLAGLVAFLVPVNSSVMIVVAVLLAIVISIYSVITVLPLKYLDSPYHTPLSAGLWNLLGAISHLSRLLHASVVDGASGSRPHTNTMVGAMTLKATAPSEERLVRDNRALVWTVLSLSDETELEPFVEGVADVLCGPANCRHGNELHVQNLLTNPDLGLRARIEDLLSSCDTGLLSSVDRTRRQTVCYRALWSIAEMSVPEPFGFVPRHAPILFEPKLGSSWNAELDHYGASAWALMRLSVVYALQDPLSKTQEALHEAKIGGSAIPNLGHLVSHRSQLRTNQLFDFFRHREPIFIATDIGFPSTAEYIDRCIVDIQTFASTINHAIYFRYLRVAARMDVPPYQFQHTRAILSSKQILAAEPLGSWTLHRSITDAISRNLDRLNDLGSRGNHWIDEIIVTLVSFYELIPKGRLDYEDSIHEIVKYSNERTSDDAIISMLHRARHRGTATVLFSAMTTWIVRKPSALGFVYSTPDYAMTALWRMCSLVTARIRVDLRAYESTLATLANKAHPGCNTTSLQILLKLRLLERLVAPDVPIPPELALQHPLLPAETAFEISTDSELPTTGSADILGHSNLQTLHRILQGRANEAQLDLFSELFEFSSSDQLLYNAPQTLAAMKISPSPGAHPAHQLRFALGLHSMFQFRSDHPDLLKAAINSTVFLAYCPPTVGRIRYEPWLDHGPARQIVKDCFVTYEATLSEDAAELLTMIRTIVQNLDEKHAEVVENGAATAP
ncbi:hypothetical protein C8J57DRAFT_1125501 [Mycena rebaudengoi]|nr:hypothetical protein C8J57DRAFT_1125501 [Mycena rebaudengoi]